VVVVGGNVVVELLGVELLLGVGRPSAARPLAAGALVPSEVTNAYAPMPPAATKATTTVINKIRRHSPRRRARRFAREVSAPPSGRTTGLRS